MRLKDSPVRIYDHFLLAKKHKQHFIEAIIVADRTGETSWNWNAGREFCQQIVGTDYFSINGIFQKEWVQNRLLRLCDLARGCSPFLIKRK